MISCAGMAQNAGDMTFDNYASEIFSYRKGLSQNTVLSIMQDSRGFMWIGTWDGLNRFDGYTFQIYRPDYSNPKGKISCETANALAEDYDGNLWIGTDKGLNQYIYKTDSFKTFYYSFYNSNSLPSDSISALVFDRSGLLWIGTNKGLCSYNINDHVFKRYFYSRKNANSIPSDEITSLFADDLNHLWIGTKGGIAVLDLKTRAISRISVNGCDDRETAEIYSFSEEANNVWVATSCGLIIISKYSLLPVTDYRADIGGLPAEFTDQPIFRLLNDKRGRMWIGTPENGIYIFHLKSGRVKRIFSDFNSRYGLSNNAILSFAGSAAGEVWIGTMHGLNMFSDYSYKFPHYVISGNQFEHSHNLIWAFQSMENGNIVIGTHGGLLEFNFEKKQFYHFSENDFGNIPVRALKITDDKKIWVGTLAKGLYLLDQRGNVIEVFRAEDVDGIAGNDIWKITPDKKNNIWIACTGGVSCINLTNYSCKTWAYPGYESKGNISGNVVYHVMVDETGIVWISTFNGLNRLDPVTGKIYVFHHDKGNPASISNDRILSTFEDSRGNIWVGTFGGGLCKYDRKTGIFRRFSKMEGMPDNVIYNIIEDEAGYLWLTSNSGLIRFNQDDFTNTNYDVNDGIQSHEFNGGAAEKLADGSILVGGMNGFNYFNPKEIKVNRIIPKLVITDFKIFGKPYGKYIEDEDTIVLGPSENFFSVSFSALDFTNPTKNQYQYILKNYDKEWIHTDALKRTADYTDVKPGVYRFMVKGTNGDGIWNDTGISFVIIVKPPFYKTWVFRLMLVLAALLITWLFIRGRVRKVRQQNEVETRVLKIEKEMFDLEQKALRLQMNPHFIFNSLNSIQSYIISNDTENAINYLAKFSQLMRLILTTSREAYIPLSQEISLLKHYLDLENMRFNNRFVYEIRVESGMDTEYIGIPPMIIQPYIENAIIHGFMNKKKGECRLMIQMWEEEDYILCVIEDNGIGREKAMEIKQKSGLMQKSQGIIITKERLDILNKQLKNKISVEISDLKDEAGNATGTRVRLVIPFTDL